MKIPKRNVMLDIETLGTKPGAVILSIGAVKFDLEGISEDTFYNSVSIENCLAHGMTISGDTLKWWMKQNEAARRKVYNEEGSQLQEALEHFAWWLEDYPDHAMWGNGAAFDNAHLSYAYSLVNVEQPWNFWNDRCYRTVKSQYPEVALKRTGVHHNALDDARTQAKHLISIWKHVGATY